MGNQPLEESALGYIRFLNFLELETPLKKFLTSTQALKKRIFLPVFSLPQAEIPKSPNFSQPPSYLKFPMIQYLLLQEWFSF